SEHLARAVAGYGVARDRIVVIPSGVDAEEEFAPERIAAKELGCGPHVLYPGRLTEQKDPLLMVQVAAAVTAARSDARFHVIGAGDLEERVRTAVRDADLDANVRFHPPTTDLAPWYAASDVLLMTSRFEGVPYVLYEAMAMGLPSVVPKLPGNAELLGEGGGILVDPRDRAEPYAAALLSLLNGNGHARELGAVARTRVRRDRSVRGMADAHAEIYERLVRRRPPRARRRPPPPLPPPHRLPRRPATGQPRVSVVMPCYDHAQFLPAALESVRAQDYPDIEIIVVDDASTDSEMPELLAALERDGDVSVVRREVNGGPGAARNTGIRLATGRYILPVDADNLLMRGAIASMVRQLQGCGEQIGFIYPNVQYFGNRHDYFVAPHFDVEQLRTGNYCDTCSLIDRSVFDGGFFFPEDIRIGHEDWDFFLTLATHGIHGEPAAQSTMRYRKTGFTRSDIVEYRARAFADDLPERHPPLFPSGIAGVDMRAARRREAALKAVWQPAISLLLLEDVDPSADDGRRLLANIAHQSLCDAEVIAPFSEDVQLDGPGAHLRRVAPDRPDRLEALFELARANFVVLVQHSAASLLEPVGFFEKLVYARQEAGPSVGIAFTDCAEDVGGPFALLRDVPPGIAPVAVALFERYEGPQLPAFSAPPGHEVAAIVGVLEIEHVLQWRCAATGPTPAAPPSPEPVRHDLAPPRPSSARDRNRMATLRYSQPTLPADVRVRRWDDSPWPAWTAPESTVLVRCRQIGCERRLITLGGEPPAGYEVEYWLGAVQLFGPPGTSRIEALLDEDGQQVGFRAAAPDEPAPASERALPLGHVEQAGLPLLQQISVARVHGSGQLTLVAGSTDPLLGRCDVDAPLGYVEAFPNLPAAPLYERPASRRHALLLRGLVGRRHVYGVDALDGARVVAKLAQLLRAPVPGTRAVAVRPDGTLVTDAYTPEQRAPGLAQTGRWIGAPLAWRGESPLLPRVRATGRRLTQAAQLGVSRAAIAPSRAAIVGYLYEKPGPVRIELFSAVHPITGDQIVTPFPLEPADMGYVEITSLGYACGGRESVWIDRYPLPWASRFGLRARHG
ncbi:MAG TPA: glycosyltransferase, partial [Solirubrobacteraceae bacterium]